MTTYSTTSTSCSDFPAWTECGCAIEQGAGYDNTDGVHTYCVGTVKYLAESLTDDKNCDDPLEGSRKDEPTWRVQTYADFVGGKQDPLQDCNGAVLPEDTQVVTCTDMTQREAVLNTAINSRQAPLLSCAGNALPANTRVPTCDEMNNAIANVDTGTAYALRDCGGAALPNNSLVASCDNLTQGMATVAGQIPQLTKCGGDAVDGSLVQCDQLGTDFSVDNDGNITINFPAATQNDGVVTSGAYANQTLTLQRTVGGPVQITGFPSQYSLRNCAGVAHTSGAQVPSCAEMNAAIAAAGGGGGTADGVVTGGSFAGETLTLNRSVGAPVTIQGFAQVQNLQGCDGELLGVGTQVPTCAEFQVVEDVATANAQQHTASLLLINDKQDQLRNCAGTDLAADDQVVACTEFSELFDAEFADADKCLTLVDIGDECGEFDLVTAVACADGSGHKLGIVPGGASCFGVVTNTGTGLFPVNPDTALGNELYENGALAADFAADTVDYTLLNNSVVACGTFTVPCDGVYDVNITNEVQFTYDYLGVSQWVMSVDGVVGTLNAAGNNIATTTPFPNSASRMEDTVSLYLTAGTHTVCRHLIGVGNVRYQPAQVLRNIGTTQVCRQYR